MSSSFPCNIHWLYAVLQLLCAMGWCDCCLYAQEVLFPMRCVMWSYYHCMDTLDAVVGCVWSFCYVFLHSVYIGMWVFYPHSILCYLMLFTSLVHHSLDVFVPCVFPSLAWMYWLPVYAVLCALCTTAWISVLVACCTSCIWCPMWFMWLCCTVLGCVWLCAGCMPAFLLGGNQPVCLCGDALAPLAFLLCWLVPVLFLNATLPGSECCRHSTVWLSSMACVLLHHTPYPCKCYMIGKLWIQTHITTTFQCDILCIPSLITQLLQLICRRSSRAYLPSLMLPAWMLCLAV